MTALDGLPTWLMAPVALLLVLGSTLTLLGALGLFRLKDFYDRIHAPTLGTSWGTAGILLASLMSWSWVQDRVFVHELVIGICVMVTTPVTLMLLGRAALHRDRSEGHGKVPFAASLAPPGAGTPAPGRTDQG
jgi:multicomponent K+:H+ antiporter subunit G